MFLAGNLRRGRGIGQQHVFRNFQARQQIPGKGNKAVGSYKNIAAAVSA